MGDLQANGLHQALLRSNNSKLNRLVLEPLMMKKSEFKLLSVGDLILLGKTLPPLYIYRKNGIVGQATVGVDEGREVILITAKERMDNLGKPDPKYFLLTSRIAVIPKEQFIVGKLVRLPEEAFSHILLYAKEELIATAKIVKCKKAYCLQISECY